NERKSCVREPGQRRGDLGHLHQREDALLHARAAGRRDDDQRLLLVHGPLDGLGDFLADHGTHRAAHEAVLHRADDHPAGVELSIGAENRIALAYPLFVNLEAVAIAFRVAEVERIARADVRGEFLVVVVVKQKLEPLPGADAEVIAALRAHVEVLGHFLAVDDLLALVALDPQPFGNGDLPLSRFLWLLLLAEPGHRRATLYQPPLRQQRDTPAA